MVLSLQSGICIRVAAWTPTAWQLYSQEAQMVALTNRESAKFLCLLAYPVLVHQQEWTESCFTTYGCFSARINPSSLLFLQTWLICLFMIMMAPAVPLIRTLWLRSPTQELHPGLWPSHISIHHLIHTTPIPASLTQATATEGAVQAVSTVKVSEKD